MCLLIYLASDQPLPLLAWDAKSPDFHVSELYAEQEHVRNHLGLPHVYQCGSEERCGCAFNYGWEYPEYQDDPGQLEMAKRSRLKLYHYLKTNKVLKIYPCDAEEENLSIENIVSISLADLLQDDFIFQNRIVLVLAR
jgi:hypothetical protein